MKNRLSLVTYHQSPNTGQSLVEMIISISVVSLILIALVSAITFSMTNVQFARNKAQATKYAQEAVEWMRNERDKDWTTFITKANSPAYPYCLKNLTSWPAVGVCNMGDYISGTNFIRYANLESSANKVTITVTVSWVQGSRAGRVTLDSILTKWE